MAWRRLAFYDEIAVLLSDENPQDIGTTPAPGTGEAASREDHVHIHPDLGDLHTVYLLADGTRDLGGDLDADQNSLIRQTIHRGTEFPDAAAEAESQLFWRTDAEAPDGVGLYAWVPA